MTIIPFVTYLCVSNCDNSVELAIFQGSSEKITSDFYCTGDIISDVGNLKGDGMRRCFGIFNAGRCKFSKGAGKLSLNDRQVSKIGRFYGMKLDLIPTIEKMAKMKNIVITLLTLWDHFFH